jgi:hypothetical protein
MTRYRCDAGRPLALTRQIAAGGEGTIWATDREGLIAKLYRAPSAERFDKLRAMIAHPPKLGPDKAAEGALAWPTAIFEAVAGEDENGAAQPAGFLMPEVAGRPLTSAYHPRLRRAQLPGFDWLSLHAVAYNLCWLVGRLHAAGYIVGDLKPDNLLVDENGLVSMVDLDSIQVTDRRARRLFPAPTGSDGFTAPELIGRTLAEVERTELHDRFALAGIVYLLLFGVHPFQGQWPEDAGDPPSMLSAIRIGDYPHAKGSRQGPLAGAIGPEAAHPDLASGFARAFDDGHAAPRRRPAAGDWCSALAAAIDDLRPCTAEAGHFHARSRGACPWCARLAATGVETFPPAPPERMPRASLLKRVSTALADGDDAGLSRLWHQSAWLRAQRLQPALQTRIAEAESRAAAMARLKAILAAGPDGQTPASLAEDETALRLWDGPPGLAATRSAIGDRGLAAAVEACRRRFRAARRLHAAIARARTPGSLTPAGETEVVEAYREALPLFEPRPRDLERFRPRAEEAAARLRAWDRLDRALAERDDATALAVWREAARLLSGFAPADAAAPRLREARARMAAGSPRRPQGAERNPQSAPPPS